MKVYYMNDEQRPMNVRIMDARYDPATASGDIYTILRPAEGRVFEVELPENSILYIKKWPGLVLISFIDHASVPVRMEN